MEEEYPKEKNTSNKYNIFAILALVLIFLSLLFFEGSPFISISPTSSLIFVSPFVLLGLIFSIIALCQIKKTHEKGRAMALAVIVLIILLILLLIWIVIRTLFLPVVGVDLDSMCLSVEIEATRVINTTPLNFEVYLNRDSGGDNEIGGVKLVFLDSDGDRQYVTDVPGNIERSSFVKIVPVTLPSNTLSNPNKVIIVVYVLDSSGNELLCTTHTELKF